MEAIFFPHKAYFFTKWKPYLHTGGVFCLSIYIVAAGQNLPFRQLFNYVGFYIAVLFSFLIILGSLALVKRLNKKLDKTYPWQDVPLKRFFYQLISCHLFILVVIYAVVRLYFYLLNGDFNGSGYMRNEFQLVNWMLLAYNFKLLIVEMCPTYFQQNTVDEIIESIPIVYLNEIACEFKTKKMFLAVEEIACFKRENNLGLVYTTKNEMFFMKYKMDELSQQLDPSKFIQISRSELFALNFINGYDKNKAKINMKEPLDERVVGKISEGRMKKFIKIYNAYKKQN